jgi:hypothetical protein
LIRSTILLGIVGRAVARDMEGDLDRKEIVNGLESKWAVLA